MRAWNARTWCGMRFATRRSINEVLKLKSLASLCVDGRRELAVVTDQDESLDPRAQAREEHRLEYLSSLLHDHCAGAQLLQELASDGRAGYGGSDDTLRS